MEPLTEGYRYHALTSTYGEVEQRWLLIASEPRQPQARRMVDQQLLKHSDQEIKAWKKLCGTVFACEADAQQALARFAQRLQAIYLHTSTVRAQPYYAKRGRPRRDTQPEQVFYQVDGALASSLTMHQGLVDQHSCFILATNELDDPQLSPQEVLQGYKGPGHAERRFHFERPAVSRRVTLPQKARTDHGPIDGDDDVFVSVRRLGISYP
jgi:transposase